MEARRAQTVGVPPFSPAQLELLEVLVSRRGIDERTAARETSTDVTILRERVASLARHLNLPPQQDHAVEFSQLVHEAKKLAQTRSAAAAGSVKSMTNGRPAQVIAFPGAEWKLKLKEVAAAIAKGVIIDVDPYKLRPMKGQPRNYFPKEEQSSLEDSLGMMGQIQDLIIRKKSPLNHTATAPIYEGKGRVWRLADTEYEICDGERRWRGALAEGVATIRAKLIEIDDEGAYLVAAVSNFNRVGHTTLEKAQYIDRLLKGNPPFPIEVIAMIQGTSVLTAQKIHATLLLPPVVQEFMKPDVQKPLGNQVLGKSPSYELTRLAKHPVLHEHAVDLARRYVQREIRLPQMRTEVDGILARHGTRNVLEERNQPSRRLRYAERQLTVAIGAMRTMREYLKDLQTEGILPRQSIGLAADLNSVVNVAEDALKIVGAERKSQK